MKDRHRGGSGDGLRGRAVHASGDGLHRRRVRCNRNSQVQVRIGDGPRRDTIRAPNPERTAINATWRKFYVQGTGVNRWFLRCLRSGNHDN